MVPTLPTYRDRKLSCGAEGHEYPKVNDQVATADPLSNLPFRHTVVVADYGEQLRHARISCLGERRACDAIRVRIGVTDG
jgi:hypothetical protein